MRPSVAAFTAPLVFKANLSVIWDLLSERIGGKPPRGAFHRRLHTNCSARKQRTLPVSYFTGVAELAEDSMLEDYQGEV